MINEEAIQAALQEKKEILTKRIVENMPELPQAIYLVGGYGRGEGAWYEDEIGLHPYNDFDLAVVTDSPLPHEKTEILRKQLAQEVGIKWVDIDYYTIDKLSSLTPTIHNVDLLEGGSLIYGQDVIKQNHLSLNKQEIGVHDLVILYQTRMWTFLGSWEGPFRDLDVAEARFFKNQMAKAVLAACDMRLVKLKQYVTSYRERANRVMNKFASDNNLCELVDWAIKEKMRPSSSDLAKQDMELLYFRVKEAFLQSFEYAFGNYSSCYLNPYKTKWYYLLHTKTYLSHIYSLIRNHRSKVTRVVDVFYAMNYVLHSNNHGTIDCVMLKEASKLLIKHGFIKQPNSSWDELRILTANARNNI